MKRQFIDHSIALKSCLTYVFRFFSISPMSLTNTFLILLSYRFIIIMVYPNFDFFCRHLSIKNPLQYSAGRTMVGFLQEKRLRTVDGNGRWTGWSRKSHGKWKEKHSTFRS
jgi:hypothetical protein